MMEIKSGWKLTPLFFLYLVIILLISDSPLANDELRYWMFAENLSRGYYSPLPEISLWNGPGYPLVLLPFVFLKLPLIWVRLINALFLFGAVLYFYNTLKLYSARRPAFWVSCLFGLFPPFFGHLHLLLTETIVLFLVCGFIFHFCKSSRLDHDGTGQWLAAGFYLGYLALTKIFFGYVLLVGGMVSLLIYGWKRTPLFKRTVLIYGLAFVICLPYLFYTYRLTDKILYWGDSGGLSLYTMSSPYAEELGDWFDQTKIEKKLPWAKNHKKFFDELSRLPSIQQDDLLKKQAIQNIVDHPKKFMLNWAANVGRLLFNYPYSYTPQKLSTFAYLIPNMFLVVLMVFSLYPTYRARGAIPGEIYILLVFALIAFGGSSLVSAYARQLLPLIPIFGLWMFLVWSKCMRIEIVSKGTGLSIARGKKRNNV